MESSNTIAKLLKSMLSTQVKGAVLAVQRGQEQSEVFAAGNFKIDQQYFIASTTKLYTTALVLQLVEQKKLRLNDTAVSILGPGVLDGIHRFKGSSYHSEITVAHLLAHRSGLADYFQYRQRGQSSLLQNICSGHDHAWSFDDVLSMMQQMPGRFQPGEEAKAFYSDTNFQILGKIIEHICSQAIADVYKERLFDPLGLQNTYLYRDPHDLRPLPLNYKHKELWIPKAMTSFGPDGGIVSTAQESLKFVYAFFNNQFCSAALRESCYHWLPVMFPLTYGVGIMRFALPRWLTLFKTIPTWFGHSGLSGAFAFYCPERALYAAGTVNQIASPGRSFRLLAKLGQLD